MFLILFLVMIMSSYQDFKNPCVDFGLKQWKNKIEGQIFKSLIHDQKHTKTSK
jgi:hypothetical protein